MDEVRRELRRQQVPCHEIVLAQARHETGNFKSSLCRNDHNLFGIKHGRRFAKYPSWQASVADYKKRISSRFSGQSHADYFAFLRRIGYASDPNYISKLRKYL
jgi:flagellum-specific peptidoglycan hydrolase FlgJ